MERGKRASMREGPLAALFRKTEDEGLGSDPGATSDGGPQPAARGMERSEFGQVPEPETPPEPRMGQPHPAPDNSSQRMPKSDPRLEELRPAPPSARETRRERPAEPPVRDERRVRSPEERLRGVISSDIPENIMELAPSAPAEPDTPRFGREEP
ncbi:MAG: cell division protein FtsZ, partial [Solirubrobacteraceae bacterium]|nr:cell division protein FtsZ [Solirubrobacteraceae bacterium]